MIPLPAPRACHDNGTPKQNYGKMETMTLMDQFESFVQNITGGGLLGRIVVALLILVCIAICSHLLVRWLRHIMRREDNTMPSGSIFINIMRIIVWGLGISFILDTCFGVNMTAALAALGVGGIALSLGFQDTLSNLIGGMQVSLMRIVGPGDNIQVGSSKGVVQDVTWRHTTIKNRLGETVIIPNSVISKNSVVHLPPVECLVVPFVATTAQDLDSIVEHVEKAARETALHFGNIVEEPHVLFTEVIAEGIVGKVKVEIDDPSQATPASDAITRAIAPIVHV